MSSKSAALGQRKHFFSKKMTVIALIMVAVFGTIILFYPLIFSPSQIDKSTDPVPSAPVPSTPTTLR